VGHPGRAIRYRDAPPIGALALGLALIAPAAAAGAVKTGLDRHAGMRLTLDGRVLTAKILPGRHLGAKLYGKRIDAVCASSFFHPARQHVIGTRLWPVGARRLSFRFGRDISRDARWCLIEHEASDVASVSFVEPEPIRLVAKGRGASGAWWRMGGGSGSSGEPCVMWRTPEEAGRWCFRRFAEHGVTLGVQQWPPCLGDPYFFGVVSPAAASVRLMLADGTSTEAVLYDRPRGSHLRARFFAAAQPGSGVVRSLQALGQGGGVLAERRVPNYAGEPC
jgi:hypothetical protein